MIATAAERCRVIGAPGGSHARDGGVDVGVVSSPPRSGRATTSSLGAGEGHAASRWRNNCRRIDDDDCRHRHSGGANARRIDCDADDRRARYRDIDDDRGGVVLTIKKIYIYDNQPVGLLALALGRPPVGVRSMGGGFARVWWTVVFVVISTTTVEASC